MIRDDRRGALHDRHPVRVGRARHQNGPVDEASDIVRAVDQADAAATTASPILRPTPSFRPFD